MNYNFFTSPVFYILITIIAYLIGSVPFAFILVKKQKGIDIRTEGTGNIGAMNSYDVTRSKWIGVCVFLLDFLKGLSVLLLVKYYIPIDIYVICLTSSALVLGHNYSIFLKFKGGRGLSTAAGIFTAINPIIVILWLMMYMMGILIIKKHVHVGSTTASLCTPLMVYYTPEKLIRDFTFIPNLSYYQVILVTSILCVIILSKHIRPILELLGKSFEHKAL